MMIQSNLRQKLAIARSRLWKNFLTSLSGISTTALLWSIATPSAYAQFVPNGLDPGDSYHLIFLTRDSNNAFSPIIDTYNNFIQEQAELNPSLTGTDIGITYNLMGSSIADNVSARDNALVEAPVYLTNGTFIASGFDDLWNTANLDNKLLPSPINVTQFGVQGSGPVATGTKSDGGRSELPLGSFSGVSTIGDSQAVGPQ